MNRDQQQQRSSSHSSKLVSLMSSLPCECSFAANRHGRKWRSVSPVCRCRNRCRCRRLVKGEAANRGFGFFLYPQFILIVAGPPDAAQTGLNRVLEGRHSRRLHAYFRRGSGWPWPAGSAGFPPAARRLPGQAILGDELFAVTPGDVSPGQGDGILGHVARTDFDACGHAAQFPIVELVAGGQVVAVVDFDANAGGR